MIINYVLIIGLILDLILTYNYLRLYKNKFPKKDFTVIESNPLIRYCIRKFGLIDGVVYSGFIILGILILILFIGNINFKFFLAGAYYMMITFHLTNLLALKRMKGGNENGKEKTSRGS